MTPSNTSNNSSSDRAIIIFDWDDTILPSSFVDRAKAENLQELPQHYHNLFREIEQCTEKCLAAAAKHGEVLIITNSDEGWVNYSAERFLPNLIPILKNYQIISARTRYENFYPSQPLCWKAAAFAHEVNEHFCTLEEASALLERECSRVSADSVPDIDMVSDEDTSISSAEYSPGADEVLGFSPKALSSPYSSTNPLPPKTVVRPIRREIISFGDSMEERTAVKIVSDQLNAVPKSVMFISNPNPSQIIGQLTMLTHHMNFVCNHGQDLDLEITHKQADKCAQHYLSKRGLGPAGSAQEKPSIFQRILGAGSFSSLGGGADQIPYIDEEMGQFQLC